MRPTDQSAAASSSQLNSAESSNFAIAHAVLAIPMASARLDSLKTISNKERNMKKMILTLAVCLFSPSLVMGDDLESIPLEAAQEIGALLAKQADKIEKLQVKVQANVEKANGVHVPDGGLLVLPQKDLKENEELDAKLQTESGTSLGYLFALRVVPIVNGKRIDATRLRTVKISHDGVESEVFVLLLAGRRLAEDDYRLYVYGKDKKPLVDAKFSEGSGPGPEPVAVEVKDVNEETRQGKVMITVFGKYQASFQGGAQG